MRLIWRGLRPRAAEGDEVEPHDPAAMFAAGLKVLAGAIASVPVPLLLVAAILAGGDDDPPRSVRIVMVAYPVTLFVTAALLVVSARVALLGGIAAAMCAVATMLYWWDDWAVAPLAERDRLGEQVRLTIWYMGAAALAVPLTLAAWLAGMLRRPPHVEVKNDT